MRPPHRSVTIIQAWTAEVGLNCSPPKITKVAVNPDVSASTAQSVENVLRA